MPPEITFRIDLPVEVRGILYHTLKLLENHFQLKVKEGSGEGLLVSDTPEADIQVSNRFIEAFSNRHFDHRDLMQTEPLIFCEDGTPDYLGTCAYMVHFLQEYIAQPDHFDDLQRFLYEKSYQYRFGCVTENLVLQYLISLKEKSRKLDHIQRKVVPSELWVSHDIDYLYHNHIPELKTALKNLKLTQIFQIIKRVFKHPDEEIFDRILSINQIGQIKSTFFWLASQDPFTITTGKVIDNANYNIATPRVRKLIEKTKLQNSEIGVHQSLGCRDLVSEKNSIDPAITINRNHYLAGKLPDIWMALEKAKIDRDASAGFSSAMGFRNSYGWPVRPFDPLRNQPYGVIAYPLHMMDATFMNQNLSPEEALLLIQDFLERHRADCQISLLWHNNYFSEVKFGGWVEVYEQVVRWWGDQRKIMQHSE